MAKPDPVFDQEKKAVRKAIQGQIDAADLATGVKTPTGKIFNDKSTKTGDSLDSKNKKSNKLDIDDFLKQAKKGFVDLTPEKNDKPFNGQLGDVEITRLTQGDGKY